MDFVHGKHTLAVVYRRLKCVSAMSLMTQCTQLGGNERILSFNDLTLTCFACDLSVMGRADTNDSWVVARLVFPSLGTGELHHVIAYSAFTHSLTHSLTHHHHHHHHHHHNRLLKYLTFSSHQQGKLCGLCLLNTTLITNRMPKALILIADGSEEIEFVTPYDGMCCRGWARYSEDVNTDILPQS